MKRPLVPLLVIALAAGLAAWLWWGASRGAQEERPTPDPAAPAAPTDPEPAAPLRLDGDLGAERAPLPNLDEPVSWVAGRVEVPAGAGSESITVYALAVDAGARKTVQRLYAIRDGSEEAEPPLASTEVELDGRFRLELPPGTGLVRLAAIGPRCWSMAPALVASGTEDARVQCRLGARVMGRVRGLETGEGEPVRVWLDVSRAASTRTPSAYLAGERSTTLDEGGRFVFEAVPLIEGQRVRVTAPGAAALVLTLGALAPGEDRELEFRLRPGARVLGRVVDEQGAPVAEAQVGVFEREPFGLPGRLLREATSDTEGRFALDHVRAVGVVGQVVADGFEVGRFPLDALGDGLEFDTGALVLSRGSVIAGRVELPGGEPAEGADVRVRLDLRQSEADQAEVLWRGSTGEAVTDAEGRFEVSGLQGQSFEIEAELERNGRRLLARRVSVEPASGPTLRLMEPVPLEGRVRSTAGDAVVDFVLRVARERPNPMSARRNTEQSSTFRDPEGRWSLPGLLPGRWTLGIEAPGYATPDPWIVDLPSDEPLEIVLDPGRRVDGTVLDPEGRPIAGAHVRPEGEWFSILRDGASTATLSDTEGRFTLDALPQGQISLVAEHERYVASLPSIVEPADQGIASDLRLRLRAGGTIRGRAFDRDGEPLIDGRVMLIDTINFRPALSELEGDGRFEVRRVVPGTYQVLTIPDLSSAMSDGREGSLTARLLGESSSEVVEVADGQLVEVDLGRPLIDPVVLSGRVVHRSAPAARHFLSFVAEGRGLSDEVRTQTDEEGRYELTLREPGPYLVTVTRGLPPAPNQSSAEFRRTVPAASEHRLDLTLPGASIGGRVRDADDTSLIGVPLYVQRADGVVSGSPLGGPQASTVTDAEGRYRFDMLEAGRYQVRAGGPVSAMTAGAEAGFGAVLRSDLELPSGGSIDDLDFQLERGSTLAGRVLDAVGEPATQATVFVRDEEGRPIVNLSMCTSNSAGRFEMAGLVPGRYTVVARRGQTSSPIVGPVEVRSDGTGDVELQLEDATLLIVRVEVDGEIDPSTRVTVLDELEQPVSGLIGLSEVVRDLSKAFPSDEFRIGPLPAGRYRVLATAGDGRERDRSVQLRGQDERRLRIRID